MSTTQSPKVATLVLASKNEKVGDASATYASIDASCPKDCSQRDAGCYAQSGNVGIHVNRLDRAAEGSTMDTRDVARQEAKQIRNAISEGLDTRPLRLHVSGDCRTPSAARELAKATEGWRAPVWSYTHAWKSVPREAWGRVSVLASVDKAEDIPLAFERGYAPALVVSTHESRRAYEVQGIRGIPCPAQTTEGVTCVKCGLCMRADWLHETKAAILFAAHGSSKRRLTVVK